MRQGNTPPIRRLRQKYEYDQTHKKINLLRFSLVCCMTALVVLYLGVLRALFAAMKQTSPSSPQVWKMTQYDNGAPSNKAQNQRSYVEWRQMAVDLAKLPPSETLAILERDDPFGVRALSKQVSDILQQTLDNNVVLERVKQIFPCPKDRLSFPDQRNHTKAEAFRKATPGYFIFFQHLRKAGGTNICTLATANLPKKNLPSYYCMPDYYWHHQSDSQQHGTNGCAGCLHRWSNQEIVDNMGRHRIAGNEWDSFDPTRHLELPAVFISSFRRPLDRAVSQFRFECLENRGCHFKEIEPWWEKRRDLINVYTWTFSDVRQGRLATSQQPGDIEKRSEAVGQALDVIVRFHVLLVMEYLPLAAPLVESVLGFTDTSVLTKHVRPHNGQIHRQDSLIPKDFLTPDQYRRMSEALALDEILTDAAQRLFWERLVCHTY